MSAQQPTSHEDLFPDDVINPKVLYVGNIHPLVEESLLIEIFSKVGEVVRCKLIPDGLLKYAFVEFTDHNQAASVKSFMNEREVFGHKIKINWKTQPKKDTSQHYHIFVGDLSPEVQTDDLIKLFSCVGKISDARVVKDPITMRSRGYGFVSFVDKVDAEKAKDTMNGMIVGSRAIRINWATRKVQPDGSSDYSYTAPTAASATNTSVYVGNIGSLTERQLRNAFEPYGEIDNINVFTQKGYAFVLFRNHTDAADAISSLNSQRVDTVKIKVNWGKENWIAKPVQEPAEIPASSTDYSSNTNYDQNGYQQPGFTSAPAAPAAPYAHNPAPAPAPFPQQPYQQPAYPPPANPNENYYYPPQQGYRPSAPAPLPYPAANQNYSAPLPPPVGYQQPTVPQQSYAQPQNYAYAQGYDYNQQQPVAPSAPAQIPASGDTMKNTRKHPSNDSDASSKKKRKSTKD